MIEVVMALLKHNDKILIAQRKKGKHQEFMWEFPGGKLEAGETLQHCLEREFMEEMEKPITVGELFAETTFTYPEAGDFHFRAYWADCADDTIPALHEHEDARWVAPEDFHNYAFCPADKPFIEKLLKTNR